MKCCSLFNAVYRCTMQRVGRAVRDAPMVEIASYGDTPFNWDRDTRDRYDCRSTNVSYRVLGQPGATCPIEARIPEVNIGPGGAPSVCCTSRQGPASHEESLRFLRTLKAIDAGGNSRIPRNLRRILNWINLQTTVSDIGNVNANAIIVLHSDKDKYLDLLKFAVISSVTTPSRTTRVHVRLPNAAAGYECKFDGRWGNGRLCIKEGSPLYGDVIRIVNEAGGPIQQCDLEVVTPNLQQLVRLDPIHATWVTIHDDPQQPRCVDLAAITSHFATGNQRQWTGQAGLDAEASFAVVRSSDTIQAHMLSLFQAMKSLHLYTTSPIVHVRFRRYHTNQALPANYTGVTFQAGEIHAIGRAMADMQGNARDFESRAYPTSESIVFRYRHSYQHWIRVSLFLYTSTNLVWFDLVRERVDTPSLSPRRDVRPRRPRSPPDRKRAVPPRRPRSPPDPKLDVRPRRPRALW